MNTGKFSMKVLASETGQDMVTPHRGSAAVAPDAHYAGAAKIVASAAAFATLISTMI